MSSSTSKGERKRRNNEASEVESWASTALGAKTDTSNNTSMASVPSSGMVPSLHTVPNLLDSTITGMSMLDRYLAQFVSKQSNHLGITLKRRIESVGFLLEVQCKVMEESKPRVVATWHIVRSVSDVLAFCKEVIAKYPKIAFPNFVYTPKQGWISYSLNRFASATATSEKRLRKHSSQDEEEDSNDLYALSGWFRNITASLKKNNNINPRPDDPEAESELKKWLDQLIFFYEDANRPFVSNAKDHDMCLFLQMFLCGTSYPLEESQSIPKSLDVAFTWLIRHERQASEYRSVLSRGLIALRMDTVAAWKAQNRVFYSVLSNESIRCYYSTNDVICMVRNYSWAAYLYAEFVQEEKNKQNGEIRSQCLKQMLKLPDQSGMQECISYPKTPKSYEHYNTAWVNTTHLVLERVELTLRRNAALAASQAVSSSPPYPNTTLGS